MGLNVLLNSKYVSMKLPSLEALTKSVTASVVASTFAKLVVTSPLIRTGTPSLIMLILSAARITSLIVLLVTLY